MDIMSVLLVDICVHKLEMLQAHHERYAKIDRVGMCASVSN